ncbi:ATP-dependent permease [Sporothrix epigloea]|uniref:ATP-dependent permease n=1 Tax=Sporothrix epigloea TaxID=1892477 RepID=A0ABP0DUU5_9PEZI
MGNKSAGRFSSRISMLSLTSADSNSIRKDSISYPMLEVPVPTYVRSVRIENMEDRPRLVKIDAHKLASSTPPTAQQPCRPHGHHASHGSLAQSTSSAPRDCDSPSSSSSATKEKTAGLVHLFVASSRQDGFIILSATAASAAVAACKTAYALILGKVFQVITDYGSGAFPAHETLHQVGRWCLWLTVLGVGMAVCSALLMGLWIVHGETRARKVRRCLFDALLAKDMAWFDTRRGGGVASLMTEQYTHIRDLQAATSQLLGYIISDAFVCIACLVVAFAKSWALTLVLLATVPLSVLVLGALGNGLKQAAERQREALNQAAQYAAAALAGLDLVKVYGGDDTEKWQYLCSVRSAAHHCARQALSSSAQMGFVKLWMISLFVVGFWYGITLVTRGSSSAGNVLTAFYAILTAFQSLEALGTQWVTVLKGTVAGKALQDIIVSAAGDQSEAHTNRIRPIVPLRDIVLENVSFAYPSNPANTVLDNCSMAFPAGQLSFVVGRSGSGKSTIADLLVQFYTPTSGRIVIDGVPIDRLDSRWLREHISLIQQSSTVFDGTFGWNVALGAGSSSSTSPTMEPVDTVSRDDIKTACETALLQSTVTNLPQGLDTVLGGCSGASLSGGQRQRLALARAKIRNPAVLVLDETTSGLDPTSAQMVLDAVRTWRRGKTTLVITHDIGQIAAEDHVFVLDRGRLVQEGAFGWLRAEQGSAMHALLQSAHLDGAAQVCMSPVEKIGHGKNDESDEMNSSFWDAHGVSQINASDTSTTAPGVFRRTSFISAPLNYSQHRQSALGLWPSYFGASGTENSNRRSRRSTQLLLPPHVTSRASMVARHQVASADNGELSRSRRSSLDFLCERGAQAQTTRMDPVLQSPTGRLRRMITRNKPPLDGDGESHDSRNKDGSLIAPSTPLPPLRHVLLGVWPTLDRAARLDFVCCILACLIVAICNPAFSFAFARMLQAFWAPLGISRQSVGRPWALVLVGIAIVDGTAVFAAFYLAERVGLAWVTALRMDAFTRLLRQPKGSHPYSSPAAAVECLDRGGEEMRKLVSVVVPILLMTAGMVAISIVWALAVFWQLTLVILAVGPVVVLAATAVASRVSNTWEARANTAAERVSAVFSQVFCNIRVVRALTLEAYFTRGPFAQTTEAAFAQGLQRAWRTGIVYGINQALPNWLVALVFYYGTTLLSLSESVNRLLQVINLLLFSIGTAAALLSNVPQIAASKTVAAQMLAYARLPLDAGHEHCRNSVQPASTKASLFPIRMDRLAFCYPGPGTSNGDRTAVLRSLSLTIQPGELVGIVGASGGGKSTVLSLLLRLYADEGELRQTGSQLSFNSIPADQMDTRALRSHMAYVPQQPYLFPATLRHNITYGLSEVNVQQQDMISHRLRMEEAGRAAGMDQFVASLPEGYDTVVGNTAKEKDGEGAAAAASSLSSLSGGQAQRVCIARALFRRPQLLVMDEPTSALDAASAEAVRCTLQTLRKEAATHKHMSLVVATHSKAMMQLCDRLLVVKDGAVAASGSYAALLAQGNEGVFAQLLGEIDD